MAGALFLHSSSNVQSVFLKLIHKWVYSTTFARRKFYSFVCLTTFAHEITHKLWEKKGLPCDLLKNTALEKVVFRPMYPQQLKISIPFRFIVTTDTSEEQSCCFCPIKNVTFWFCSSLPIFLILLLPRGQKGLTQNKIQFTIGVVQNTGKVGLPILSSFFKENQPYDFLIRNFFANFLIRKFENYNSQHELRNVSRSIEVLISASCPYRPRHMAKRLPKVEGECHIINVTIHAMGDLYGQKQRAILEYSNVRIAYWEELVIHCAGQQPLGSCKLLRQLARSSPRQPVVVWN